MPRADPEDFRRVTDAVGHQPCHLAEAARLLQFSPCCGEELLRGWRTVQALSLRP